ncbi:MAG: 4Fe-4S dicluster domain-containing protein [Bacillota bacterium]
MNTLFGNQSFIEDVKLKSGQPIDLCFQCQKCASGCSLARFTDYTPNQILRFVQMGLKEKVLNSSMIWLCSSCEICGSRCPNGIKMAEVMDALKEIAIREKVVKEKKVQLFNDVFLATVRSKGRIHEAVMMTRYKMKTGDFFSDLDLGLKMFLKRKLPLIGKKIRDKKNLELIFKRSLNISKQNSFAKCSG